MLCEELKSKLINSDTEGQLFHVVLFQIWILKSWMSVYNLRLYIYNLFSQKT